MDQLLQINWSEEHLRGTGRLDTPETSVYNLAAVEAALYPRQEPDEAGTERGACMAIGNKSKRPLVELWGLTHARSLQEVLLR